MNDLTILNESIGDSYVKWVPYKDGDDILNKFSKEDWHLIASDVNSEDELSELLRSYPHKIQGFVLYEIATEQPIAFVYILKESSADDMVSYHGGGWHKSMHHTILYSRGTIVMVEKLLSKGFKVITYNDIGNKRAFHFMQGVGFAKYYTSDTNNYMFINDDLLKNSKMYEYLYKTKSL